MTTQTRDTAPSVATTQGPRRSTRARRAASGEAHAQPWIYAVLGAGLVVLVGPFIWMLLGSFRTNRELREVPPSWLPENPTLDNYRRLFDVLDFPTFFFNSAVVATAITLGNLVFC